VNISHPETNHETDCLKLSVVIPAMNEEDGIATILQDVLSIKTGLVDVGVHDLEVIVVDDGSVDATAEIAERFDGVRVVRHSVNRGYGAAIKTGFASASGGLLAFLDADSTYPPNCLIELCRAAVQEGADLAIGSRRSGAASSMPPVRRLGNFIWSSLLSIIGSSKVSDPASGMRVLRRECLGQLYPLPDGLNFTPVMSTRAVHEDLKVVEIPIPYHERSGRSKLSVVRDGFRFLTTIIGTALQYNPARILELAGITAIFMGAAVGFMIVGARFEGVTELGPLGVIAVFSSLVLGVGGVTALSVGISFNHLVAMHHSRPIKQVNLTTRIVGVSPERHLGKLGLFALGVGLALAVLSLVFGFRGWEITRLWFWLLGSALFLLIGCQLLLFSVLIHTLDTLGSREKQVQLDLQGDGIAATVVSSERQPSMQGAR